MHIYVSTRGRGPTRQLSASVLRDAGFPLTICCHPNDRVLWPDWDAEPIEHDYLFEARQAILDATPYYKVLFVDDDFNNWSVRRPTGKFTKATPKEIQEHLTTVADYLNDYPMVGIGQRYMANVRPSVVECGRINGAYGLNVGMLRDAGVRFRISDMEDFDLNLQLLTKGHKTLTYSDLVYEQVASGTEGGCSAYRTNEFHTAGAKKLEELWPQFVRTVEKTTKNSWGGQTRTDVIVGWRRAYESSQR